MHEPAVGLNEELTVKKGERATGVLRADNVSGEQLGGVMRKSKAELVNVLPGREGAHRLKVIVKNPTSARKDFLLGDEDPSQSEARRYYERWRYLKKIGIPVVSSMRVVGDDKILMGDMTADGSDFVGKETYWNDDKQGLPLSEIEDKFLQIDPSLIKKEIEKIFSLAWKHGLVLPDDNEEFTVLVHPDGTWKVMVKDLDWLRQTKEMESGYFEQQKETLFKRVDMIRKLLIARKGMSDYDR